LVPQPEIATIIRDKQMKAMYFLAIKNLGIKKPLSVLE